MFSKECIQLCTTSENSFVAKLIYVYNYSSRIVEGTFLKDNILTFIQRNLIQLFIAYRLGGVFKLIKKANSANCFYSRYGIIFDSF